MNDELLLKKKFQPDVNYQVGVLKGKRNAQEPTFDLEKRNFTKIGQYFLDKDCPDTVTYFRKNPDALPSDQKFSIFGWDIDHNKYIFIDEANPDPFVRPENATTKPGLGDASVIGFSASPLPTPVPVGNPQGNNPKPYVDFEEFANKAVEMQRRDLEAQMALLKQQNEDRLKEKDSLVSDLRKEIVELRNMQAQGNPYLMEELKYKNERITELEAEVRRIQGESSQRIVEAEKRAMDAMIEAQKAKAELESKDNEIMIKEDYESKLKDTEEGLNDRIDEMKQNTLSSAMNLLNTPAAQMLISALTSKLFANGQQPPVQQPPIFQPQPQQQPVQQQPTTPYPPVNEASLNDEFISPDRF